MAIRVAVFILLSQLAASSAFAQQQSCRVDLPVGMIGTDGSLLNGLTAKDVTVRLRKQTLRIETIGYDTGPRRVLFILDTSRRLPPEVRKAETMLVNFVFTHARPGDSFALQTARGALRQVRFGESHDALTKAIDELAADPKETGRAQNVLDAMVEGISWFGEPRTGDAILMMGDHLEESHSTTEFRRGYAVDVAPNFEASHVGFKTVAESLNAHRIRVFGLQFGGLMVNPSTYEPNDENLLGITIGSGGYLLLDTIDPHGSYVLTDVRERSLQHKVFQLYGAICQFYTLSVTAPASLQHESWKLDLAKDLQGNTVALYSRRFDPCQLEKPDATVK
jgi:hypothetical protein